jgi:hypothetical protein
MNLISVLTDTILYLKTQNIEPAEITLSIDMYNNLRDFKLNSQLD